jgi:PAS domain S-box-containing protein
MTETHIDINQYGNKLIKKLNLPNLLSITRLTMMPVMLIAAWSGMPTLFIVIFSGILLLALADGVVARRWNLVTDLGAELDSWGSFATYVTVPIGIWILYPELVHREAAYIIAVTVSRIVPGALGLLKFGRLPGYHTWASGISALLLGGTTLLVLLSGPSWPFHIVTPIVVLSGIEEIFMTAILRRWQVNIPSLYHAMKIQQQKVEKALEESERKYRTILANIEDGYFELDLAGNLTFFNSTLCKHLGYTENELIGMNNREMMSEEQAKTAFKTFNSVYETGRNRFAKDWEIIGKNGRKLWFEISIALMSDSKGQPTGFRCFGRNTTERRHTEEQSRFHQEQLYQASKMVALGTLVSGVAHDINNPNNFIMLNTPLLKEAWEGIQPILHEYYEENGDFIVAGMDYTELSGRIPNLYEGIIDGSNRIQHIVDDLKKFVRKGKADLSEEVDVNALVKSALSLLRNMIEKSTHCFSVSYGNDLPILHGNFHRLEQVVINLVQNACQAIANPEAGISISTAFNETNNTIIIEVADEGKGIPAESLHQITDTFYTTKYEDGGIGLGLSISSRIVEEHGGRINFTSQTGKGTKVTISLPVRQTKKSRAEVQS